MISMHVLQSNSIAAYSEIFGLLLCPPRSKHKNPFSSPFNLHFLSFFLSPPLLLISSIHTIFFLSTNKYNLNLLYRANTHSHSNTRRTTITTTIAMQFRRRRGVYVCESMIWYRACTMDASTILWSEIRVAIHYCFHCIFSTIVDFCFFFFEVCDCGDMCMCVFVFLCMCMSIAVVDGLKWDSILL